MYMQYPVHDEAQVLCVSYSRSIAFPKENSSPSIFFNPERPASAEEWHMLERVARSGI